MSTAEVTLTALAASPRWVAWQTEGRTNGASPPTKVPYAAATGRKAKADDPRTWSTRAAAEARAGQLPKPFGSGGVGCELGDHHGTAVGGIDLDTCREPATGAIADWARAVLARFATYAEISPSGTGVKLFFQYDPDDALAIRQAMQSETGRKWARKSTGEHPPAIELYIANRYFAVTDQRLPDAPDELRTVPLADLEWLIREAGPAMAGAPAGKPRGTRRGDGGPAAGDHSRSARAFRVALDVRRAGGDYPAFLQALDAHPETRAWRAEKGNADGGRELLRTWERAAAGQDVLLTEHGVALAFARQFRDRLRYCHDAGSWFEWVGTHWRQDRTHAAYSFARDLVAAANADAEFRTQASTGKAAFASGVEKFAQRDPALAVTAEHWNRDPFLLATPGGTVDLRTGLLRPARPGDMMTRTTAVAPAETGAEHPIWTTFLLQATNRDWQLIGFLKRWFGYCLTGDTREHTLLFSYGPGENGKSVLLNTAARIIGDYAVTAAMDTFVNDGASRHLTFLAMLHGARLVCAAETEEGRHWAEAKIKAVTGGDPVTANFMRQDPFTYTPQFKLTIIGNHKPALRNVDDAARRRFAIVPFLHKPETPDRQLETKLETEWPAILRWMIDGCLAWQSDGLPKPDVVQAATNEYFEAQDVFGQWTAERCIRDPNLAERPSRLLADFNEWAQRNGEVEASRLRFRGWADRQNGLRHKTVRGADYLQGIGLKVPEGAQGCA